MRKNINEAYTRIKSATPKAIRDKMIEKKGLVYTLKALRRLFTKTSEKNKKAQESIKKLDRINENKKRIEELSRSMQQYEDVYKKYVELLKEKNAVENSIPKIARELYEEAVIMRTVAMPSMLIVDDVLYSTIEKWTKKDKMKASFIVDEISKYYSDIDPSVSKTVKDIYNKLINDIDSEEIDITRDERWEKAQVKFKADKVFNKTKFTADSIVRESNIKEGLGSFIGGIFRYLKEKILYAINSCKNISRHLENNDQILSVLQQIDISENKIISFSEFLDRK